MVTAVPSLPVAQLASLMSLCLWYPHARPLLLGQGTFGLTQAAVGGVVG